VDPYAVWDGVLDGIVMVEGKGAVLGVNLGVNLVCPIVTNEDFVAYLCKSVLTVVSGVGQRMGVLDESPRV